jgi:hypothetical protein
VRDGISMGSEWDFTHELKNIKEYQRYQLYFLSGTFMNVAG